MGLALLCAITSEPARAASHPVALEIVSPGREGLELTARLAEDTDIISHNITWTIRTAQGEPVFESKAGSVDISLEPGDYLVDAAYGAASLSRQVSLPPGTRMMASFVLEAGQLNVTSSLGKTAFPVLLPHVRVFALADGRLVDANEAVLGLPAGHYRVESRADSGNVSAVTDVEVKPGRVSTVAITHKVGLARLSFVGSPTAEVSWDIADARGDAVAQQSGLSTDLLLVPGTYTARATVGGELLSATFRITAGEARDILLGN